MNGQSAKIEGYIFESGNRGYLNNMIIEIYDQYSDTLVSSCNSNVEGFFSCEVPLEQKFTVKASHEYFHESSMASSSIGAAAGDKIFLKIEMKRAPGYLFEITMAEERENNEIPVDAIKSSRIEVYNNTTKEMVLKLDDYEQPDFKVHLKKGNHYTLMIRKDGYITKRMEAFVDVKGCILCFEGIGEVRPGVTDNLTEQNSFGTLLANVELERIYPGKEMKVNTIYYAPASYELSDAAKMEMDKLKLFMTDNPNLIIELGSHTDSRGNELDNNELSLKRAQRAVSYILEDGNIKSNRLIAKGYGFSKILNHCKHGVKCSNEEHAVNRRTELKLLGVLNAEQFFEKSLASMKQVEHMDELLAEIQNEGVIEVPDDAELANDEKGKRQVKKINKEFEEKSTEVRNSVKETVQDIVEEEERQFYEFSEEELAKLAKKEEEEKAAQMAARKAQSADKAALVSEENSGAKNWMRGHKIVLFESKEKLSTDHDLYREFDKINVMISPISQKHMYIIGEFQSEIQAQKYLDEKLDKKYNSAYLISF